MSRKKRAKTKVAKGQLAPAAPKVDHSLFIDDVATDKHEILSPENMEAAEPGPLDASQATQVFSAADYLAKLPAPRPLGPDEAPATEIDVRLAQQRRAGQKRRQ